MSNVSILNLEVAIDVTGDEWVPLVQGGTTKRAQVSNIANTATGFVPTSRRVDAGVGLSGGGALTTDVALDFAPNTQLSFVTSQAAADAYVIAQDSSGVPRKVTFANSMKAIDTLTASPALDLTADKFVLYRAADGLTYSATASQISLAAGNVPAGGTTGQVLAKISSVDYDTEWINNSITLDALSIAANPTGAATTSVSVTLGSTLSFSGTSLRTAAGTGDVTWSANSFATTISANVVTNAKFRQSVALSVVGNATNATTDVADIAGTADQVLRVNGAGTALAFGSIDLSQSAAVGTSVLSVANGGTGVATTTAYALLAGGTTSTGPLQSLAGVGTSGQVLVSNGAGQLPTWQAATSAIGQALTRVDDTNVTLTLGGSPTTALLSATSITAGWTGQLALTRGGTAASLTASNGGIVYSTAAAMAILSGTATAGQIIRSGSSAAPSWSTSTYPATSAAGTILASLTANTITATSTPTLGIAGTTIGTLAFAGNTSGTVTVTPQAAAGTPTLTFPNASGTFAVSATAPLALNATTGDISITAAALTKVDDTNVTLTLGGAPTTALLAATSLTLGWTGQLALARGGTAASLTASNGGVVYSTSSAMAILAGTATAGQILRSGSSAAPSWSTSTYPATSSAGTILASGSTNTITATETPTLGVQQTTQGQLILANTAAGAFPVTLQSSNSTSAAWTLTLPTTAGTNGFVLSTNGSGVTSWVSVGGTGTVTDVSFTGGLISVANSTTTPALTVAGTSGGIPYFSSASTWASSAALDANAIVLGGGAGAAPATTTTGTGVVTAIGNAVNASGGLITYASYAPASGKTLTVSNSLTLTGTDSTSFAFPSTSSTVLTTGNTATITKGYAVTPYSIGSYTTTQGTTPDPANGNYQYVSLSGSFTWTVTAPSSDCAIDINVALGASGSGVTVAFSSFKTPGTGAAGTFTAANDTWYVLSIRRINGIATYSWNGPWT